MKRTFALLITILAACGDDAASPAVDAGTQTVRTSCYSPLNPPSEVLTVSPAEFCTCTPATQRQPYCFQLAGSPIYCDPTNARWQFAKDGPCQPGANQASDCAISGGYNTSDARCPSGFSFVAGGGKAMTPNCCQPIYTQQAACLAAGLVISSDELAFENSVSGKCANGSDIRGFVEDTTSADLCCAR